MQSLKGQHVFPHRCRGHGPPAPDSSRGQVRRIEKVERTRRIYDGAAVE